MGRWFVMGDGGGSLSKRGVLVLRVIRHLCRMAFRPTSWSCSAPRKHGSVVVFSSGGACYFRADVGLRRAPAVSDSDLCHAGAASSASCHLPALRSALDHAHPRGHRHTSPTSTGCLALALLYAAYRSTCLARRATPNVLGCGELVCACDGLARLEVVRVPHKRGTGLQARLPRRVAVE